MSGRKTRAVGQRVETERRVECGRVLQWLRRQFGSGVLKLDVFSGRLGGRRAGSRGGGCRVGRPGRSSHRALVGAAMGRGPISSFHLQLVSGYDSGQRRKRFRRRIVSSLGRNVLHAGGVAVPSSRMGVMGMEKRRLWGWWRRRGVRHARRGIERRV